MNGDVQLIVKKSSIAPGTTVLNTYSGYITSFYGPNQAFAVGDLNSYVGKYVHIYENYTPTDYGTYLITSVNFDGTFSEIFPDVPFNWFNYPTSYSVALDVLDVVQSTTDAYLDLFENESISQNWKFQDLTNFTAQGSFSREFRVPFSENNQLALGSLFDVNVDAGTANYFHYKLPAEIRVDTLPIATGYIRVRKIYKQLNRINEVELAFYAETPDLVRNIGEKKLKDIIDLPNLDEIIQYDNVTNPNANRIWTLCDRAQLWSEQNEINARSLSNSASPLYATDLTPALNWWYLFNNIITEAGFNLVAGTLQNILEGYWMPWCNSQRLIGSDTYGDLLFEATQTTPQLILPSPPITYTANTEVFDNNNNYDPATYTYTTPSTGYYTFNVNFNVNYAGTGFPDEVLYLHIGLLIDGVEIPSIVIVNCPLDGVVYQRSATFTIGIDAGSQVQLRLFANGTSISLAYVSGSWSLINATLAYGQSIDYSGNAPDMKQIDFVTDVIKMHNCAIVADRAIPNKIYIVPQNSYLGSGNELDWTSKLDVSKDVTLSSTVDLQKAKFQFTYTAGADYLSTLYKNVNRIYGDYEAVGYTTNPNTSPSDFAIGDQKLQLITQSTPCGVVPGTSLAIPQFFNDAQEFVAPGPRCLYEAGSYDVQLYDDSILSTVLTSVPILNHYSVINANIDDYDLNWAPEVPPHAIITNPYNNLFNLYWRTYMNALYSPEARLMEAYFALDLKDIITFQFSDKVWIQDSWWRILEVNDYKVGMNESTQVKLIKFLEDTEDCSSTPVSVSVTGEVNFENGAGDPVEPTQDCCTRYGYDWDETTGTCWAFTLTNNRPSSSISGRPTSPATRSTPTAVVNRTISNSVINGRDVVIELGNANMLAVGNDLELTKDVRGSNLLGKNTYTNLPGIHLGGGYMNDNPALGIKGYAQSGNVILHYKDAWADTQIYNLDIEGVPGEYITLPDDTIWSCILNVTILDTGTNNYCIGQYSFGLQKISGLANDTGITVINEVNYTPYTFVFGIDTSTDVTQHRINLQVNGLGFTTQTFIVTASIQYQQNKSL